MTLFKVVYQLYMRKSSFSFIKALQWILQNSAVVLLKRGLKWICRDEMNYLYMVFAVQFRKWLPWSFYFMHNKQSGCVWPLYLLHIAEVVILKYSQYLSVFLTYWAKKLTWPKLIWLVGCLMYNLNKAIVLVLYTSCINKVLE